jgi:hypothetical protein
MKKNNLKLKNLKLTTETVRCLTDAERRAVAGGIFTEVRSCPTCICQTPNCPQ